MLVVGFILCSVVGEADISGTYIDAKTGNTAAAAGGSWYGGSSAVDKLWWKRTGVTGHAGTGDNAILGTELFEASPSENACLLATTIAGLAANLEYKIRVQYWSKGAGIEDWRVKAGLATNLLSSYSAVNGTNTGHVCGSSANIFLYEASLGSCNADSNGTIKVYVDDFVGGQRSWYEGVSYEHAGYTSVEGFDYQGSAISNQNGGAYWSGPWVDGDGDFEHLSDDNISLNSAAFPFTPTGGRIVGNNGEAARDLGGRFIDMSEEDHVMYFSALMRKDSTAATSSEVVEIRADNTTATAIGIRFGLGSSETFFAMVGNQLIATKGGSVAQGTTYFVVAKLVSHASVNDEAFVKAYAPTDTVGDEPDGANWTVTTSGGTTDVIINRMGMFLGSNLTSTGGSIDEIRIGKTWSAVTESTQILRGTLIIFQ